MPTTLYPDEPRLHLRRAAPRVCELFEHSPGTAMAASRAYIVIGTETGRVCHFSTAVEEVHEMKLHHASAVVCLAVDEDEGLVASGAADGRVLIQSLSGSATSDVRLDEPVTAVALGPGGKVAVGTETGAIHIMLERRTPRKPPVVRLDGPVRAITWRGTFLAAADMCGVWLIHSGSGVSLKLMEAPSEEADIRPPPFLCWMHQDQLAIGWSDTVCVMKVSSSTEVDSVKLKAEPISHWRMTSPRGLVAGLAPMDERLFILTIPDAVLAGRILALGPNPDAPPYGYSEDDENAGPCMILTSLAAREETAERIDIGGWRDCSLEEIHVAAIPEREPGVCLMSRTDLIVAHLVSHGEHCSWLCQRKRFDEALLEADAHKDSIPSRQFLEIMEACACGLLTRGESQRAADILAKVLPTSGPERERRWERWLFVFASQGAAMDLVPLIPGVGTGPARSIPLSETAWGTILAAYLAGSHAMFADLLDRCTPTQLSNPRPVIAAVVDRHRRFPHDKDLARALGKLYDMDGQPALSLAFRVRAGDPASLEYADKHQLRSEALRYAGELFMQQPEAAAAYFRACSAADVKRIVKAILVHSSLSTGGTDVRLPVRARVVMNDPDAARPLIVFLTEVARYDRGEGKRPRLTEQQEATLVRLAAMHDPANLRNILGMCNQVSDELKKSACRAYHRVEEYVYLLRKDNSQAALTQALDALLDENTADGVDDAVQFVWGVQGRYNLWDYLAERCAHSANVARLLELVCSGRLPVDPRKLVEMIPADMPVDGLSRVLTRIIADADMRHRLWVGCSDLIRDDTVELGYRLYGSSRRGIVVRGNVCSVCSAPIIGDDPQAVTVGFDGTMYHSACMAARGAK